MRDLTTQKCGNACVVTCGLTDARTTVPKIADFFAGMRAEPEAVLVAEGADGHLVAIAEPSIRTNLPSRLGQPVGYVEGLFVVPEARGPGIARALLQASREWARQQRLHGICF